MYFDLIYESTTSSINRFQVFLKKIEYFKIKICWVHTDTIYIYILNFKSWLVTVNIEDIVIQNELAQKNCK